MRSDEGTVSAMEGLPGDQLRVDDMVKMLLAPTIMARISLRLRFSRRPDPPAYLAALRALPPLPFEAEPVLTLSQRVSTGKPADSEEEGEGMGEPVMGEPDMVSFPFPTLREIKVQTAVELRHKEAAYLAKRRQALFRLRDYMWAIGALPLRQVAAERHWGTVPAEVARRVQDARRNRKDTRMTLKELWRQWPTPFDQTADEWDEVYLAEFPEIVDKPERPGSVRWRSFYSKFTRDFLGCPPDIVFLLMRWVPQATHTLHFPRGEDEVEYLDRVIAELDPRLGRDPSQMRAIQWEVRLRKEEVSPAAVVPEGVPELSEASVEYVEGPGEAPPHKVRRMEVVKGPCKKSAPGVGVTSSALPVGQPSKRGGRGAVRTGRYSSRGGSAQRGQGGVTGPAGGLTADMALNLWRSQAITHVNAMINLLMVTQGRGVSPDATMEGRGGMEKFCELWESRAKEVMVSTGSAVGQGEGSVRKSRPPCEGAAEEVPWGAALDSGVQVSSIDIGGRTEGSGVQPATEYVGADRCTTAAANVAAAYMMALRATPEALIGLKSQVDQFLKHALPPIGEVAASLAAEVVSRGLVVESSVGVSKSSEGSGVGATREPVEPGELVSSPKRIGDVSEVVGNTGMGKAPLASSTHTTREVPVEPEVGKVQEAGSESVSGAVGSAVAAPVSSLAGEVSMGQVSPGQAVQTSEEGAQQLPVASTGSGTVPGSAAISGSTGSAGSPMRSAGRAKPRASRVRGGKKKEGTEAAVRPSSRRDSSQKEV